MKVNIVNRAALAAGTASVVIGVAALASASSGAARTAERSAHGSSGQISQAALVAGSKKEHGLLIFSNANLPQGEGGGAGIAQVDKAFEAKYPWIHVTATDDADPVVFSKYAAEHATGTRTADILLASAPGLWVGAVRHGYLRQFTPVGISNYPSLVNQGHGLYVFSADPAITIWNKKLLAGHRPPSTIAGILQAAKSHEFKLGTYTVTNQFGYSVFWAYVHHSGWAAVDRLGSIATAPGDGGVIGMDVLQGGLGVAVFESGVARGAISHIPTDAKLAAWQYSTDFTPLVPRAWGITAGAASPDSAELFMDFVYSNEGQKVMCQAGFEAMSNTYSPPDCQDTLKELYKTVGGQDHTYMTPFTPQVANEAPFIARWRKAFHQ
jgi:iron(III) transport system substrate-binding protein